LKSLLAKDPTLGGAHVFLGLIEAGAENYAAAREHLVAALERVPMAHMGRVHAALGQVYLRLGDYANAENEYQKALALDVGDQEARLGLAVAVYSLGGSARAVDLAQDIVPDAPNGAHQMGVVLQSRVAFDDGQFLQAAQLLQGLLEDSDGSAKMGNPAYLQYLAGLLSMAGGDAAAAEAHLSAPELVSQLAAAVPISATQSPVLSPPRVLDDAWSALAEHCAAKWQWEEESARLEVLVDDPCLPVELGQRIAALYDIWQDQLGKRFYDTGILLEVLPIFALPP
jgi:tetratricopeptide (TPR) repeat protein